MKYWEDIICYSKKEIDKLFENTIYFHYEKVEKAKKVLDKKGYSYIDKNNVDAFIISHNLNKFNIHKYQAEFFYKSKWFYYFVYSISYLKILTFN